MPPRPVLTDSAPTTVQQFAAEAAALDVGDMRDIPPQPRRDRLRICFLSHAQVHTRDARVEMLRKRMRRPTTAATKHLHELQDPHRALAEQRLAVFANVIEATSHTADAHAALGQGGRDIFTGSGGAEALRERYEQVSAYHHTNYRPLLWGLYRPSRAELFRLSPVRTVRAAPQAQSLLAALHCLQRFQHPRRASLPAERALDFASVRWHALIRTRRPLAAGLTRRPLEGCVLQDLDHGLRCGDGDVEGSATDADSRQLLLPWDACRPRFPA